VKVGHPHPCAALLTHERHHEHFPGAPLVLGRRRHRDPLHGVGVQLPLRFVVGDCQAVVPTPFPAVLDRAVLVGVEDLSIQMICPRRRNVLLEGEEVHALKLGIHESLLHREMFGFKPRNPHIEADHVDHGGGGGRFCHWCS